MCKSGCSGSSGKVGSNAKKWKRIQTFNRSKSSQSNFVKKVGVSK